MRNHLFKISAAIVTAIVLTVGGIPSAVPGTGSSGYKVMAADGQNVSFFEAQGLSEMTATSFTMKTSMGDPKTGKDIKDVMIPVEFVFNGEKPASRSGYKTVSATFNYDASVTESKYGLYGWYSAFDRDSGINLESAGAKEFKASVSIESDDDNYPVYSLTITVTCPEDYYGTMFYCGYENAEMYQAENKLDLEHNSYKIDELPNYVKNGKNYYFFRGNDKPEVKKHSVNKKDIQGTVQGAAKGTVKTGEVSVSFKEEGGNVLLVEDSAELPDGASSRGYTLVLDSAVSPELSISMDVKEPDERLS